MIRQIVNTGPAILVPAVIAVMSLLAGVKPGRALRSALMIGVGFVGMELIIGMMNSEIGAAAGKMTARSHMGQVILDVGWPGVSPMAWASDIALLAVPLSIAVNLGMLVLGKTKTLNVDIWNIWHMIFNGALVYAVSGNYLLGLLGVGLYAALSCKLGDLWGPLIGDYFMMDGITTPHGTSAILAPIACLVDIIIERVPALNRIDLSLDQLQEKAGVLGEPLVIGFLLGTILGFQGGYAPTDALLLGVRMAAVMVLMPRIVKCVMEGLIPFTERMKEILHRRYGGDALYIGLDPSLLLGDPQVVTAGLLLVPITLLLAVLMPGNRVIPLGDLATAGFFVAIAAAVHNGNLFRTILSGSVIMAVTIKLSDLAAPWVTELARTTGMLESDRLITALDQGGSPVTYVYTSAALGKFGVTATVTAVFYAVCLAAAVIWMRGKMKGKEDE